MRVACAESAYSRGLYPPGSNCQGAPGSTVDWSEDSNSPFTLEIGATINPSIFPLNKTLGCTPVYPNNFLLVNTMFQVRLLPQNQHAVPKMPGRACGLQPACAL